MAYRILHNLSSLFPSDGAFYYSLPCSNCSRLTSLHDIPEHTQVPTTCFTDQDIFSQFNNITFPFHIPFKVSTPYPFLPVLCFPQNSYYNLYAICLTYAYIYHLFPATIKLGIPPLFILSSCSVPQT